MKKIAPYGSWKSPVTPEFVSGKDRGLASALQIDGDSIYFLESRPDEAGRTVLMRWQPNGEVQEVLPSEFNVRTRYLEYGGMAFFVSEGTSYFTHFADQEIYVALPGQAPRKLTNTQGNRFADISLDRKRNRLIALREVPGHPESKNSICGIDLETGRIEDLVTGADFYNCPRLRGDQLLWVSWNHPNMAWNGTELWVADLNDLHSPRKIAGDPEHAVSQAQWGPAGEIFFAAELGEYVNLYRWKDGQTENVFPRNAEFATADWVPGMKQFAISAKGEICATFIEEGRWRLIQGTNNANARIEPDSYASVQAVHTYKDGFVAIIEQSSRPATIVTLRPPGGVEVLYAPKRSTLAQEFISVAEELRYPTEDGGTGYAWYYPPTNGDFAGAEGERPPLVVCAHGGPTTMSPASFRKEFQFWTSRGYAVVDVNYAGSTGYGRRYRERLRNNWGLVDINDCVAAVKALAAKNLIDPKRVAIRGGSAGGYTTLAALTFTQGTFSVGASYYGVSDLELLAKETHKLESRYLDQLVGPYPAAIEVYKSRAPLEHIDQLKNPIIFFQGDEDKVVPPNQSALMHESLKRKGIPTEYHLYSQEGHGFRRAETNQHALKSEHAFYARFFGFEVQPADRVTT